MESVEELCDSIALINHSKVVLTGEKNEVRNRFKAHQFEVLFDGNLTQELQGVDLVSLEMSGDQVSKKGIFKLQEGASPNHLLGQLINQVQVQKFQELIPSFNDIFIQVVNETN